TALHFRRHFDLLTELREFFAAIRPTPFERVAAALTDGQRLADLARLVRTAPVSARLLADDLAREQFQLTVRTTGGRGAYAGRRADVRALSVALVSGSLAVVAAKGSIGVVWQMLATVAATTLALFAVAGKART